MVFLFQGYKDGLFVSGCKEFSNKSSFAEYLEAKGISGYNIFDTETKAQGVTPYKDMSIFCRQMSVVFYSDITIMEGIMLIQGQADHRGLKAALSEIYLHMKDGMTLASAISMYTNIFSQYFINMVKIGEASGTLDMVFYNLSNYFEKENNIRIKIKSALTYPVILAVMMAAVITLLIVKVLPMFSEVLESFGQGVPSFTKAILGAGPFLSSYGLLIAAALICFGVAAAVYGNTVKGKYLKGKIMANSKLLNGFYSKVIVSRFSRSLGILLKSGVNIVTAFKEVSCLIENKYIESKLEAALIKIENGADFAESLKSVGVFPPLFIKMAIIGGASGKLDEMLEKTASIFEEEVKDSLEKITSLIEPLLIIILSVVVGIILLSVMLPMIEIMTNIG